MSSSSTKKLKLLALHGYTQSADAFRARLGSIRNDKTLKNLVDWVFVDGPHVVVNGGWATDPLNEGAKLAWWLASEGPETEYRGWEQSLAKINEVIASEGPFDGILGFSQGAALTALIISIRHASIQREKSPEAFAAKHPADSIVAKLSDDFPNIREDAFKFAVLCGGFLPRDKAVGGIIQAASPFDSGMPSLHIIGQRDEYVPPEKSYALAALFRNAEHLEHPDGHYLPAKKDSLKLMVDFFQKQATE